MFVLQKYEGNGGIIELLNLPFGSNPQAALPGLQRSLVFKFQSH